jgi:hypothetical protein
LFQSAQGIEFMSYETFQGTTALHLPSPGVLSKTGMAELTGAESNKIIHTFGQEVAKLSLKIAGHPNRWWTVSRFPLTCPLSGFPINLLPYPPFKLQLLAGKPNPNELVDGKFMALLLISTGNYTVNGRPLEDSEIMALGEHIQRCKLGSFRPDHALALAKDACNPEASLEEQSRAVQALQQLQGAAKVELDKLRRIQEERLLKMYQKLWKDKKELKMKVKLQRQRARKAAASNIIPVQGGVHAAAAA